VSLGIRRKVRVHGETPEEHVIRPLLVPYDLRHFIDELRYDSRHFPGLWVVAVGSHGALPLELRIGVVYVVPALCIRPRERQYHGYPVLHAGRHVHPDPVYLLDLLRYPADDPDILLRRDPSRAAVGDNRLIALVLHGGKVAAYGDIVWAYDEAEAESF